MKRLLGLLLVLAAVLLPAAAQAKPSHHCDTGGHIILASLHTSCGFAHNIARRYELAIIGGPCDSIGPPCTLRHVESPATRKQYTVVCHHNRGAYLHCVAGGTGGQAWMLFAYAEKR
jgi:hypothetical protein